MGDVHKCSIDKFNGDSIDSISFSPLKIPHLNSEPRNSRHLNGSWLSYKNDDSFSCPHSLHFYIQNPNKAIVTIDAHTTEILTANKTACFILGIRNDNKTRKLSDYIASRDSEYLFSEADLESDGVPVLFCGKVIDLMTGSKQVMPFSFWARKLCSEGDLRCLVVMEPVERVTGTVKFDNKGKITSCDKTFAYLFGYLHQEDLVGTGMMKLIPYLDFSCENKFTNKVRNRQSVTGRTIDGFIFPLSIDVLPVKNNLNDDNQDMGSLSSENLFEGNVWVFKNMSGLITLQPDGTIHSCNSNFSLLLFGYTQSELSGKNISMLIPSFYEDVEYLDTESVALPPFDDDDDDDDSNPRVGTSDGRTTADSLKHDLPRPMNPMGRNIELIDDVSEIQSPAFCSSFSDPQSPLSDECESSKDLQTSHPNFHLAESPLQSNKSDRLACSESQDTLHSCSNNSVAESDINANFFYKTPEEESAGDYDDDSYKEESDHSRGDKDHRDLEQNASDPEKECEEVAYDEYADINDDDEEWEDIDDSVSSTDSDYSNEDVCNTKQSESKLSEYAGSPTPGRLSNSPVLCSSSRSHKSNVKMSSPKCPLQTSSDCSLLIPEGDFVGSGRHKDGANLNIKYSIKKVALEDGKVLYCLWVSRDPEDIQLCSPVSRGQVSNNCSVRSSQSQSSATSTTNTSESSNGSMLSDSEYIAGEFSENYTILKHLRKGAFGCIKLSYRNTDGLLVIAKFICKSEVYSDSWVFNTKLNQQVPLEISLLTTVNHPNIVKVLDVFENESCFQMVMEKHGSGMDLFEFIERKPDMDEQLCSYIFRQIVSALSYLHDLTILHRDIKDENVIINEKFHVKLIDFGSATFMSDEPFSSFLGTMEYCSPEVIQGNKYQGPELEMFALGVTLYTLIFGENPFVGAEEILKGEYKLPSKISIELKRLIGHLLEPDPSRRCTLFQAEHHPWVTQRVNIENYKFSQVVEASKDELCPPKYFCFADEENEVENSNDGESIVSCLKKKMEDLDLSNPNNLE